MQLSLLIALDQAALSGPLARAIDDQGHAAREVPDVAAAGAALAEGPVDACFLGVGLSERAALARTLTERGIVVVMVAAQEDAALATSLVPADADDVLVLPASPAEIGSCLRRVLHLRGVLSERDELRAARLRPVEMLLDGPSQAARRLRTDIERVARTPRTTVLVHGEHGTHRTLVAREIHTLSARKRAPFRTIDCFAVRAGALSEVLAERLLESIGGTLVLREVDRLSREDQLELARVLADPPLDVRTIATTTADLAQRVGAGRFAEELLYRLNVLTVEVPPLRDRAEDVPAIARRLLARRAASGAPGASLSAAAEAALTRHAWPGNLGELEAAIARATLAGQGQPIQPAQLGLGAESGAGAPPAEDRLDLGDRSLRHVEEALIRRVLQDEGGNRSRAARVLGINRSTLYNKLRLYSIE